MHQRAQKREKGPIAVLGKIGDERATETLHDDIDGDGDPRSESHAARTGRYRQCRVGPAGRQPT